MPDTDRTDRPRIPMPGDWNEAFAALPIESPGNDGWQRLTRALDGAATGSTGHRASRATTQRRARWPLWLATAAAVSAVALVPLLRQGQAPVQSDAPLTAAATAPAPAVPTTAAASTGADSAAVPSTSDQATIASAQPAERIAARRKPVGTPTRKPAPATAPQPTRNDDGTRIASTDATSAAAAAQGAATPSANALADSAVAIQSLQAESAQLEALVALARDERVSSASGAALGVELDDRIGRIDAALSQSNLPDHERAGLWQQRVEAMRELAGIETTQRWLVTRGERYDGALVSVD